MFQFYKNKTLPEVARVSNTIYSIIIEHKFKILPRMTLVFPDLKFHAAAVVYY
jgi:hypothetical protein